MPRTLRVRSGSIHILYALLVFALCGLAGVVIDLGFARHTQTVMQSAVDTAALEGIRHRDAVIPLDIDPDDPQPDQRTVARAMISLAFADAQHPSGEIIRYGAGPILPLTASTAGPAELNAAQTIIVPTEENRRYKPQLELNRVENAPHGDIVVGVFTPMSFVGPAELNDYSRQDGFTPLPTNSSGDALLVRLRRTYDPSTPGDGSFAAPRDPLARSPGISSSGPQLPYLFARGSTMGADPDAGYQPRVHGVSVRGTAIAQAVPAKAAGPRDVTSNLEGVAPVALSVTAWQALPLFTWHRLEAGTSAVVWNPPGHLLSLGFNMPEANSSLTPLDPGDPEPVVSDPWRLYSYVPLYDDAIPGFPGNWVVGFGIAEVAGTEVTPTHLRRRGGGTAFPADLAYRSGQVLRNISASVHQQAGVSLPSDPTLVDRVLRRNRDLGPDVAWGPILAR